MFGKKNKEWKRPEWKGSRSDVEYMFKNWTDAQIGYTFTHDDLRRMYEVLFGKTTTMDGLQCMKKIREYFDKMGKSEKFTGNYMSLF